MILPVSLMAIDYVYWDSMCFIYRIGRKTEYITALEEITRRAENNEIMLVTSVFTLAEVAVVNDKASAIDQEKMIMDFFDNDFIYLVSFDEIICRKAREIVRTCKLKGKDAVHVASALSMPEVTAIHTNDTDIIKNTARLKPCPIKVQSPEDWLIALAEGQLALNMESKK